MYSGKKTKTGQVNRKSAKLETKKKEKTRPWLRGTRNVLAKSEVKRNTKLFMTIKRLMKMRGMKLKKKSNSGRRKIIKRYLTSRSNCKKQKMIVTIAK